jgi:hypothetical protein
LHKSFGDADKPVYMQMTQPHRLLGPSHRSQFPVMSFCFLLQTFAVEFSNIKEGKEALNSYMQKQGYRIEGEVLIEGSKMAYDVIYSKL